MSRVCCPKCQDKLVHSSNSVKCDCCQAVYPVYSGVIDFHGESDDFYEGKFGIGREKKSFLRKWIEPIYSRFSAAEIRNKHQKYFRKLRTQKGKAIEILDLGCGPYAKSGGITSFHLAPSFISCNASVQPGITPLIAKTAGWFLL